MIILSLSLDASIETITSEAIFVGGSPLEATKVPEVDTSAFQSTLQLLANDLVPAVEACAKLLGGFIPFAYKEKSLARSVKNCIRHFFHFATKVRS